MAFVVKCPEDVKTLGWVGNFDADLARFDAVDRYIQAEPDLHKRQLADCFASVFGMGEKCEIDPDYDPRR